MIVAFPFAFNGREDQTHLAQADLFIRVMRKLQPSYKIVQLTDRQTRGLSGIDGEVRVDSNPLGVWYFTAMSQFPANEFLRLDYDIVIRQDVSDVFKRDFDVAVSTEDRTMNNGVVFVKSKRIFGDALKHYLDDTRQDNLGDIQIAMTMAMRGYNVLSLPREVYNYRQESSLTTYPDTAKIVHFKGSKKKAMVRDFEPLV